MAKSYSLFKNRLKKTIIDAMYAEVINKTSRYYHWLGKENSWADFLSPFIPSSTSDIPGPPQNNFRYDLHVRRDILTAKAIGSSDVSYVVPRIDWEYGVVYDMYDDAYTTPIAEAIQWHESIGVLADQIIKYGIMYYRVAQAGQLGTTPPTHTVGTETNGTAQLAYLMRDEIAYSGATSLETAKFYVLTSEFNVYKCIWNGNNAPSTVMPTTTPIDSLITTADGYKWKFMYTIPVSLRNRFLSAEWIPVVTALKSRFYTNGSITSVIIDNQGSGYSVDDVILVTGDGYLADNPYIIEDITIIDAGLGYTVTPNILFSVPTVVSGLEESATGTVTISGGVVNTTLLTNPGFGYESPSITIDEPLDTYSLWQPNATFSQNTIIKSTVSISVNGKDYMQDVYYNVDSNPSGVTGVNAPTHATGTQTNGSCILTVVAKRAVLIPSLTKTEADLLPIIEAGKVIGVEIVDGGVGYTNANIEIFANGGGPSTGTGAVLIASYTNGNLTSIQADVEGSAVPGSIEVIKVVDPGSNYGSASVEILGDGVGATAEVNITSGAIQEVIVTNPGYGYTWTDTKIIGNGTGATARAIMSPTYGHGSNAVEELNANSLMFYSSISRDKNQGIEINNDYRKAGLIKNLRRFNPNGLGTSTELFTDDIGSGCVLIEGTFDSTKLDYDLLIQKDGYKNYRVIDFTDTKILLSVFNNFTINVGDSLSIQEGPNAGYAFAVTKVTERTIDQFSGDLLFVSVRESFSPMAEQIITLRTVITI